MKKVFVIGGGPVGLYTAKLLAEKGFDVSVFEEHKKIGEPVQCSGILTKDVLDFIPLDKSFLVNRLKKVIVHSKRKRVCVPVEEIVVDRAKFDRYFAKECKRKGVKIFLGYKFLGERDGEIVFADPKNKFVKKKTDIVIGADGPLSDVAQFYSISGKRKFYVGVQARVRGKFDPDAYEVYMGSVALGFFAWVIPESSKVARVGLAGRKGVSKRFSKFMSVKGFDSGKIIEKQGGLIPIYSNGVVCKGRVFIVGDAGMQVKSTTGGGIVPGFRAAKVLVDSLVYGNDYNKGLRKVKKELFVHSLVRGVLDRFNDRDYDYLLELISKPKVKKILNKVSRDRGLELVFRLVLAEPRFLKFLTKTF